MADFVRIKIHSDAVYMKRIRPVEEINKEDVVDECVKHNVKTAASKNFDKVFEKYSHSRCMYSGKYAFLEDENGNVKVDNMNDFQFAEYCIDKKTILCEEMEDISFNHGHQFEHVEDLRRYTYLKLRETHDESVYSEDCLKWAISYYYKKKWKSFQERKKRFLEKAFANKDIWTHFATFTYNPALMSDDEFESKLRKWLQNRTSQGVKYQGVFEKTKKGQSHFHCIISLPKELIKNLDLYESEYYDKSAGKRKTALISRSLEKTFGRCDFEDIFTESDEFMFCLRYICKYILKEDHGVVYSRGLQDEFIGTVEEFNKFCIGCISMNSTFALMERGVPFKKLCLSTVTNTKGNSIGSLE